jgi:heme-degrading monooxygenase HmoA
MIVRIWRGLTSLGNADAYRTHLTQTVFPALIGIRGHTGAYTLQRQAQEQVEFLVVTVWESMEAIQGFAGIDTDNAVVEPEARTLLAEFDNFVRHYKIVDGRCTERYDDGA